MHWAIADPISGDYHVVTKTTTDVPAIVMKEELPDVGRAAFAVSSAGPENQERADYRATKFTADAAQWWQAWSDRHPEGGIFRTVETRHPRHEGGMNWTVKYLIEEFAGKSAQPARRYIMDCRVTLRIPHAEVRQHLRRRKRPVCSRPALHGRAGVMKRATIALLGLAGCAGQLRHPRPSSPFRHRLARVTKRRGLRKR